MNSVRPSVYEKSLYRLAVLLLIFWLLLHALWRFWDHTPIRGDQTFYTHGALAIQDGWDESWSAFFSVLHDATGTRIRPPGASLLLAPSLALFGNDLPKTGLYFVVWHALTLLILYHLGHAMADRLTGLFSGVLYISFPLIYDTGIDPEFYFFTFLPLALLCCVHLWDETPRCWVWWLSLGCTVAFALWTKWVFAVYLLGPVVWMFMDTVRRMMQKPDRKWWIFLTRDMSLMLFPVMLVLLIWYWPNHHILFNEFQRLNQSREFTPFKHGWNWNVLLYYPTTLLDQNKIIPLLFACLGIILSGIPGQFRGMLNPLSSCAFRSFYLLFSSLLGTWIYFIIRDENVPVKYLFAIIPVLALIGGMGIRRIASSRMRTLAYTFLLIYGTFNAFWMHFAPLSWIGPSSLPRIVETNLANGFVRYFVPVSQPPQQEEWPFEKIAACLHRIPPSANSEKQQTLIVFPDLYYFDWRNLGTMLQLQEISIETASLFPRNGLMRLMESTFLLTSRGQVTRFSFPDREKNPNQRDAAEFNRLVDRSPEWFNETYRMIGQCTMPYGLPQLQIFHREKPWDAHASEALCAFWLSYHFNETEAWDQIAKVWAMQQNRQRMERAINFRDALQQKNSHAIETWLDNWTSMDDLLDYERLQAGVWAFEHNRPAQGEVWLRTCMEGGSPCAWKAALVLGQWHAGHDQKVSAQEDFITAWRLQRERPESLQYLEQLASPEQAPIYHQLKEITQELSNNNRRPLLYQNAANLLLQEDWNQDAFWYALEGFAVGFNRFPNTIPLHRALQHHQQTLPDYETLPLPYEQFLNQSQEPIILHGGQSWTFPYLNLDGGRYRLRWIQHYLASPLRIDFYLDGEKQKSKTFSRERDGESVSISFDSPVWGDRLRLECINGAAQLSSIFLERVTMEVPLHGEESEEAIQGTGYQSAEIKKDGSFSFTTPANWVHLNFSQQTDPRAWDFMRIESDGLKTPSATFTFTVRGEEREEIEIPVDCSIPEDRGITIVPIPKEVQKYPFLLGFQIDSKNLFPFQERVIRKITLLRDKL